MLSDAYVCKQYMMMMIIKTYMFDRLVNTGWEYKYIQCEANFATLIKYPSDVRGLLLARVTKPSSLDIGNDPFRESNTSLRCIGLSAV